MEGVCVCVPGGSPAGGGAAHPLAWRRRAMGDHSHAALRKEKLARAHGRLKSKNMTAR